MNYLKEVNSFYDKLETNPLSGNAINLWHALMATANKAGWINKFAVAVSILEAKTSLNKKAVERARNELQQKGYIEWNKRAGNQSAEYMIISLCDKMIYEFVPQSVSQDVPQSVSQPVAINKLNKTKLNNNKNYIKSEVEEIYSLYPGKCVVKGSSTGKCEKNKERIEKLLDTVSSEELKKTIIWYINDCKEHNTYMKNFSTFLNNIPELPASSEERKCRWITPNGERINSYNQFVIDQNRYGEDNVKFIGYAD